MKHTLTLVLALAAGLFAATQAAAAPTTTPAGSPLSFKDERCATITLPAKASRIVSLSPELTEILHAAGAGDRVVGNTTYCNYPAAAASVTKAGGFSAKTISIEAIVALRPGSGSSAASPAPTARQSSAFPTTSSPMRSSKTPTTPISSTATTRPMENSYCPFPENSERQTDHEQGPDTNRDTGTSR